MDSQVVISIVIENVTIIYTTHNYSGIVLEAVGECVSLIKPILNIVAASTRVKRTRNTSDIVQRDFVVSDLVRIGDRVRMNNMHEITNTAEITSHEITDHQRMHRTN